MPRFTVIEARVWRASNGRTASIYGALPWWSDAERDRDGWNMVHVGWTLSDRDTNAIGCGRVPWKTREEAQSVADEWNAADEKRRAEHAREWAPINAPIVWTKARGNDGVTRHHSGERYAIAVHGPYYVAECDGEAETFAPFRNLAKAKEWCARQIRSDRRERAFGEPAAA